MVGAQPGHAPARLGISSLLFWASSSIVPPSSPPAAPSPSGGSFGTTHRLSLGQVQTNPSGIN